MRNKFEWDAITFRTRMNITVLPLLQILTIKEIERIEINLDFIATIIFLGVGFSTIDQL